MVAFDPYGYRDPVVPQAPAAGRSPWAPADPLGGPLTDLPTQVSSVLAGAYGPRGPHTESQAEAWARGALIGFGSWLIWRAMKARKARVATYTTPMFRATMLWGLLFAATVVAQAVWKS